MRFYLALLAAIFFLIVTPTPAYAISEPTSIDIVKIHVTKDVLTTGDYLLMAEYRITYAVQPTETIDEAFIFRLISTDNLTELGRVLAYPFVDGGYGRGVISFYFATAPGSGLYTIRVTGNPAVFTTPYFRDFTMPSSAYITLSSDADVAIKAQVMGYISDLNPTYYAELGENLNSSDGTVISLTTSGEVYFQMAIPNLRKMSPSLFQVQQRKAVSSTDNYSGSLATAYEGRFVGTWVASSADALGNLLSVDMQVGMGLVVVGMSVLWVILAVRLTQSVHAGLLLIATQLLAGTLLGFMSMAVLSVFVFLSGLYIGIILIGRLP